MTNKSNERIYALSFGLLLLLTALLHGFVRYAKDDFLYLTYLDNGLRGFWEEMVYHARNLSGRTLVHVVLCPLLRFDMVPYRIVNTGLIGLLAWLAARLCGGSWPSRAWALGLFWLLGIGVLGDGVLWGAGSMNYLLPLCLLLLFVVLLEKGSRWSLPMGFLAGATVEMAGILPLFTAGYTACTDRSKDRRFLAANFLSAGLGYLTLFLTTGVSTRLEHNSYETISLATRMLGNFSWFCRKILAPEGLGVMAALSVAAGTLVLHRRSFRKTAWAGIAAALAALSVTMGLVWHNLAVMVIALGTFGFLIVFVVLAFGWGERVFGLFGLCMTVSLGICLVSPVVGYRLLLPTGVFLMIFTLRCLVLLKPSLGRSGVLFLCAGVLLCFYTVKYAENAKILDENYARAEAAVDTVTFDYVPDERYGEGTVPSGINFGTHYLRHLDKADTAIFCQDPTAAPVFLGGTALGELAVKRDGVWYLRIRTLSACTDAQLSWELANAVVRLNGQVWRFTIGSNAADLGEGHFASAKLNHVVRKIDGTTYISLEDMNRLFGLALTVGE